MAYTNIDDPSAYFQTAFTWYLQILQAITMMAIVIYNLI